MKKRRSRRIPRRIQAEFGIAGKKTRVGFTSNLSATGMFVGASRPYPVGTRVKVKLFLDEPLVFDTVVVHSKKGVGAAAGIVQSGMGLRLLNREPRLEAFLGLLSPRGDPSAPHVSSGGQLSFTDSEAATAAEPEPAKPAPPVSSLSEARTPSPSEASAAVADLDKRLSEAEEERRRLEEMIDADEREKRMLRQLVAKLEKARDELADQLAAAQTAATGEATARREGEAASLRKRIANLKVALADARATPPSEPPQQVFAGRRRRLTPWAMLIAGAILGGLVVLLLPGLPDGRSEGGGTGSASAPVAIAETEVDRTGLEPSVRASAEEEPADETRGIPELAEETTPTGDVVTPAPSPQPDPLVAAEETVRKWAAAWSEQRVDEYLSCYATSFEPPGGLTLGEWKDQRRDRLHGPEWIRVNLGPIQATASGGDRVTLTFEQSYETPTYRDRVRKSLELVREEEVWKIAAERVEG